MFENKKKNKLIASKRLSKSEQAEINNQIEEGLVEHLYKSTIPGVLTGLIGSISVFTYLYIETGSIYLIPWLIGFNLVQAILTLFNVAYNKNNKRANPYQWLKIYCLSIASCALFWGAIIVFMPADAIPQYIVIAALVILASAYTNGTVGVFPICALSIGFILFPVSAWLFLQNNFYTTSIGAFLFIYYLYLVGMNYRSTKWLKHSLRLKIENTFFTHQANHDLLTGLPNNRLLMQYMESKISELQSKGYHTYSFAVVSLSINRLEMFNTSLGYEAGDTIIQTLAKKLQIALANIIERNKFRGKVQTLLTLPRPDAFTIVLEPINVIDINKEIFEIFKAVNLPIKLEDREAIVSASVGISIYPKDGDSSIILLSNSQAAMLKAKKSGGDKVIYYEQDINKTTPWRLQIENDLHNAIKNKELQCFYQPLINAKDKSIYGMEILVRWQHPQHGMISPGDFIDIAEETGLIIPLGEYMLYNTCKQIVEWNKKGFGILGLKYSVNVSAKQLQSLGYIDKVKKIIKDTGVNPKCLDFEFTENEILDNDILNIVKDIKNLGISVSIDDFGTGYSGFGYLRAFNADKIKIDKAFISDININPESQTIVSAILAMAKELNIKTVGEGVETKEELKFLQEKNCDLIQGYYFSRPVPEDKMSAMLLSEVDKIKHLPKSQYSQKNL